MIDFETHPRGTVERLNARHESDRTLVRATEECARKHQDRAAQLLADLNESERQTRAQLDRVAIRDQRIKQLQASIAELNGKYDDLIYQVAHKFMGESRHETAKRYIVERENRLLETGCDKALDGDKE